jgi:hypothetical protein
MEHQDKALQTKQPEPCRSFDLASYKREELSESCKTPPLSMVLAEHGHDLVAQSFTKYLSAADAALGGGMSQEQIAIISTLAMDDFKCYAIGNIIRAIRRGVKQKAVGHKLTYPMLCEWMEAVCAEVEQMNYNEYLRHK